MHSHVAVSASEERISLREWKCEIPSLQQYVLLHRPKQPSITYLTLALSFSMRLKCILKIHQLSKNLVVCTCVAFVFKGFPFVVPSLQKGGFLRLLIGWQVSGRLWWSLGKPVLGVSWRMVSESVASWSLKWMQSELDGLVNLTFGHETLRKEKRNEGKE